MLAVLDPLFSDTAYCSNAYKQISVVVS